MNTIPFVKQGLTQIILIYEQFLFDTVYDLRLIIILVKLCLTKTYTFIDVSQYKVIIL